MELGVRLAFIVVVGALAAWAVWQLGNALLKRLRRGDVHHGESGLPAAADIDAALTMTGEGPARSSASAMVKAWARGRACASCGGAMGESRAGGRHVALLDPSGATREWLDVPADRLPLALATSLPVCWNCHVAATFRRTHPDLVTDRDDRTMRLPER